MATAAPSTELWTVIVEPANEANRNIYNRSGIDTVADVAAQYAADLNERPENVIFLSLDGQQLEASLKLSDVPGAYSELRVVKLVPETAVALYVEFYGCAGERKSVSVLPTSLPEALHPAVRRALNIDAERLFRLRLHECVLKYNLPLGVQGVREGSVLLVDAVFEVEVEDAWEGTLRQHFVYASETCDDLLAEEAVSELKSGTQTLDTSGEVFGALGGVEDPNSPLELHSLRPLTVVDESRVREGRVWPGDELRRVLPRCAGLTFEGEPLPRDRALRDLALPAHGLLVTRPVRLDVRLRSGKRRTVRMPRWASAADVRAAVRLEERSESFSLLRGPQEQVFNEAEDADLAAVGAADGGSLEVAPRRVEAFAVRLRSGSLARWTWEGGPQRFSEVMAQVARETGLPYATLLPRTLCCAGCGRRVSGEEEEFQAMPVGCCRVRSLELEEPPGPTPVRDAATQVQAGEGHLPRRSKSVSCRPATGDIGVQTAQERSQFAVQHPPPTPLPFFIRRFGGQRGCQSLSCQLLLQKPVNVGAVRAAVAKELNCQPQRVKLRRCLGRCQSAALVCDAWGGLWHPNDSSAAEFGDAAGRLFARDAMGQYLRDWSWQTLEDDTAPFLIVPGRKNTVDVWDR